MLPVTIDKRRNGPSAEIIKPSTDKRKAFARKVFYRRRKIEPSGKPRFDGMSLVRCEIRQMIGHQRTHVSSQYLLARARIGIKTVEGRNDVPEQKRYSRRGRGHRQWSPPAGNCLHCSSGFRLRESGKDPTSQVGRGIEPASAISCQTLQS